MAMKASTGLRNHMLGTGSFANAMQDGVIRIYSDTTPAPATADAELPSGATLLAEISANNTGAGLEFQAPALGVISKDPSQIWSGEAVATGTAAWFRFVVTTDDGSESDTDPRVQGTVGIAGADLNLETIAIVTSQLYPITAFNIALPTM